MRVLSNLLIVTEIHNSVSAVAQTQQELLYTLINASMVLMMDVLLCVW